MVTIIGTAPNGATTVETSSVPVTSFVGTTVFKTVHTIQFSHAVTKMTFGIPDVPRYMGPGLAYSDGRIYVRLDNASAQSQYNRPGVAQISQPDPRHHDLRIASIGGIGLGIDAHDVVIDGLTINDFGVGLNTSLGGQTPAVNVTLQNLDVRPVRHGARLGAADHIRIDGCRFHARMPAPRFWLAYSDIKGIGETAVHTRKTGLDLGSAKNVEVLNSEIDEFFDGILSTPAAHHINVRGNTFRQSWDDSWQLFYGVHSVDVGYNRFLGAGMSRDGTGTNVVSPAPGSVFIHHNVFAPNEHQLFHLRFGAGTDVVLPIGFDSITDAIPLSAHGLGQHGAQGYRFSWKFYYNTIVVKDPMPNIGVGVAALAGYLPEDPNAPQALFDGAPHEVYNNIFVDLAGRPISTHFVSKTGHELYDGNVYSGGWTATPSIKPIYALVHTSSGVVVDGNSPATPLISPRALRVVPAIAADFPLYTIPSFGSNRDGWEAHSTAVNGIAFDKLYRPLDCCTTGAVSLTASHWPGTSTYEPWRGAIQP